MIKSTLKFKVKDFTLNFKVFEEKPAKGWLSNGNTGQALQIHQIKVYYQVGVQSLIMM